MGATCWRPGEPLPHVQASHELRDHLTEQGWSRDTAQAVEHLVRRAAVDLQIPAGEVRPHLQAAMAKLNEGVTVRLDRQAADKDPDQLDLVADDEGAEVE